MPNRRKVVYLSIKDQDEPATLGRHRLMALRREIDNGQPPKTERNSTGGVDPFAAVIRPAMEQAPRHRANCVRQLVRAFCSAQIEKSGKTAHL